jgi:hypothetical protein
LLTVLPKAVLTIAQLCNPGKYLAEGPEGVVAKLKRLATQDAPPVLTRKVERQPVTGQVVIQSNNGDRTTGRLRDISTYGCNLACDAEWLRMGRFIAIRLAKDWTIQAIIRWTRDGATGVEFLRPISNHEAELIAARG